MSNPIDDIRARFDPGDPWGSVMGEWFGIANALYVLDYDIPEDWEFRPGLGARVGDVPDEYPDVEWFESIEDETYTGEDLIYAGNVLARYAALLRLAGKDY